MITRKKAKQLMKDRVKHINKSANDVIDEIYDSKIVDEERLRNEINGVIAEYTNDLWGAEIDQRWKSDMEVTEHIMKLIKRSEK
jgi:hypothetical protein